MHIRLWILAIAMAGQAATPPHDTEVFLASLSTRDGKVEIGKPVNISNNAGYDNQPSFTPDGAAVLFTSVRGDRKPDPANSAATGSDIYRYDIATGRRSKGDQYAGSRIFADGDADGPKGDRIALVAQTP